MKFKKMVVPGDKLKLEVKIVKEKVQLELEKQ